MMIDNWTEHIIIKAICKNNGISSKLIADVSEDLFLKEEYRFAFKRLTSFLSRKGRILSWLELLNDPSMSDKYIRRIKSVETKRRSLIEKDDSLILPKNYEETKMLVDSLVIKAQYKSLVKLQNTLTDKLRSDKLTTEKVDGVISLCNENLEQVELLRRSSSNSVISLQKTNTVDLLDNFAKSLHSFYIPTGFKTFDSVNRGIAKDANFLITAPSGTLKCITFGSYVPTSDGIFPIGKLWKLGVGSNKTGFRPITKLQIISHEGICDVSHVYKTYGKTIKLTTWHGDELEGLPDHKIWVLDNKYNFVFKRLDEMQLDDLIPKAVGTRLFSKNIPIFSPYVSRYTESNHTNVQKDVTIPNKLTTELAKFFGYVVAEGHKTRGIHAKQILVNDVHKLIRKVFNCTRFIKIKDDGTIAINFGVVIAEFLEKHTGDVLSSNRFVPDCIMTAPEKYQLAFLSALFEGDGTICFRNGWHLNITSISKKLIYQVKAMLENIGIYCYVTTTKTWATNGSENQIEKDGYCLHIEKQSFLAFEKINFISPKKRFKFRQCYNDTKNTIDGMCKIAETTNYYATGKYSKIPGNSLVVEMLLKIREHLKQFKVSTERGGVKYGLQTFLGKKVEYLRSLKRKSLTRYAWASIKQAIFESNDPIIRDLGKLPFVKETVIQIDNLEKYSWTYVTNIEQKHKIKPVYDLSVPGPESYSFNGIYGHNSCCALQIGMSAFNAGARVCLVPLEMSLEEQLIRIASNLTKTPGTRIINDFPLYRDKISKVLKNFFNKDRGAADFAFWFPDENTDMAQLISFLKPNMYDMIIIDSINLLAPVHKERERSLDMQSRLAKIYATNNKCAMLLTAQWDADSDKIKYAKALVQHSSNAWKWLANPEDLQDKGFIEIHQLKSRNQKPFTFKLGVDPETYRVFDLVEETQTEEEEKIERLDE